LEIWKNRDRESTGDPNGIFNVLIIDQLETTVWNNET